MSIWMKLIGRRQQGAARPREPEPAHDVPDLTAHERSDATLADAMQKARGLHDPDPKPGLEQQVESEGLPSVNRRRGSNKIVNLMGIVVILGVGAAMIVAVNAKKRPTKHLLADAPERVANNLPPLIVPAPPPPIQTASMTLKPTEMEASGAAQLDPRTDPMTTGPINASQAQPIPVQHNAKAPLDWRERKRIGALLISMPMGGAASANEAGDGEVVPVRRDGASLANTAQPTANPNDGHNNLAARLEPTNFKAASASLLPNRDFLITKGTSLDCALETAIDTTLPGLLTCRLTRDVYSDNNRVLLLERGTQLVGEQQGNVRQGQARIFALWTRAKTPNGVIVNLDSPGTDALGRSGLAGWVDSHFADRFGAAILMSFIQGGLQAAIANQQSSGATVVYGSTSDAGAKVVEQILQSSVNIPPTIVKNQGDHIQVMVARDLDFSAVYALQSKR